MIQIMQQVMNNITTSGRSQMVDKPNHFSMDHHYTLTQNFSLMLALQKIVVLNRYFWKMPCH